jgi:hypothetical protein
MPIFKKKSNYQKAQAKETANIPFNASRPGRTNADTLKDGAGKLQSETTWFDPSDYYATNFHNYIQFSSLISGDSVKFKAFLTAFEDQYQSEWNSEQVYGRNDPIQTFRNTTRTISLGWDCPASSIWEAKDNMVSAAKLIRMLYPKYKTLNNVATINQAPLIRVSFRNLISAYTQTGINAGDIAMLTVTLSGITFAPDLEAGFFDADESKEIKGIPKDELVPKLLKFSCEMTVLHEETIGHNIDAKWPSSLNQFPNLPNDWATVDITDREFTTETKFGDSFNKHEEEKLNAAQAEIKAAQQEELIGAARSDVAKANEKLEKLEKRRRVPEKRAQKIREQRAAAQQDLLNAGVGTFDDLGGALGAGTPGSGLTGEFA